jgi:DNA-3-methyladenine glycosylase
MFGPPGRLYVYLTYGMWHCANIVCEAECSAAAVLLRAAQPLPETSDETLATATAPRLKGPGLFCQGLELDRRHSGLALILEPPAAKQRLAKRDAELGRVYLYRPEGLVSPPLSWTTRVGFSFQDTYPWRCHWTGHPAVGKVSLKPLRQKTKG